MRISLVVSAIVLVSTPILAAAPFDGQCEGKTESVAACGPATVVFAVKDGVIDGTIKGDKGRGAIFSKSPVSSDGKADIVIGKKSKFPGTIHFSGNGTFTGKIQTLCWHSVAVQGTCKK